MKIPVAQMIFIGAAISFVVIAVRFLWVFPMVSLERYFFRRGDKDYLSFGGLIVASWAGMRGVVSLAAALALPLTSPMPRRFRTGISFCSSRSASSSSHSSCRVSRSAFSNLDSYIKLNT
jgi:hypothetical protein